MTTLPKPSLPPARRRGSIAQAADVNRAPAGADSRLPGADEYVPGAMEASHRAGHGDHDRGAAEPRTLPRPAGASPALGLSTSLLLKLPDDIKQRMVNTIAWTQPHTGIGHQQKFIRKAITDLCDRLEREFNHGQPFAAPAVPDSD